MTLRVGIIGCGGIGRTHSAAWTTTGATPVAYCDPSAGLAAQLAGSTGAAAYDDVATLLARADLDVVSICTPPVTHAPLAIAALQAGVHVIVEKPMAVSVAACDEMIAAAAAAGRLLTVGFCHRFQPHIEVMAAAIASGTIGQPRMFHNRFAGVLPDAHTRWFSDPAVAGGGVLVDTCVHSIDLFRHLCGEVAQVRASASTTASVHGPALAVEDTAAITVTGVDGVVGVIEASWRTAPGVWTVTVYGSTGALEMDYDRMQLRHIDEKGGVQVLPVPEGDRFIAELAHFAACIRGDATLRVTGADGRAAARILAAAQHDAATRRSW